MKRICLLLFSLSLLWLPAHSAATSKLLDDSYSSSDEENPDDVLPQTYKELCEEVEHDRIEILQLLHKKDVLNSFLCEQKKYENLLSIATENISLDCLKFLLTHDYKENLKPGFLASLLLTILKTHWLHGQFNEKSGKFIASKKCLCVKALLRAGAQPNILSHTTTPLHLACFQGCPLCVNVLLIHNADPAAHDKQGKTPLKEAQELLGKCKPPHAVPGCREIFFEGSSMPYNKMSNPAYTYKHFATCVTLLETRTFQ
ncbi:ankyrin repeat domain-containing protein [Candidatus Babeliales bacterium]|nr:ankyrin repeat domain-containing protein [Candidatus Babeliales bacterium]